MINKYHIAGYEKPSAYNKLGLFDLVMRGPAAVTLGLDPEYFQYYRNDREEGPYLRHLPTGDLPCTEWSSSTCSTPWRDSPSSLSGLSSPLRLVCVLATRSCSVCPSVRRRLTPTLPVLLVSPFVPSCRSSCLLLSPSPFLLPLLLLLLRLLRLRLLLLLPLLPLLLLPLRLLLLPPPTPTPTPTPEPWFPIYDPFILGDNCYYEVQSTCFDNIILRY